jgi:5'-3' exonuclease
MRLLLIDGHYYCYRSFYAIRDLRNSRGEATNAVYGFVKTIRKMLKDLRPDLAAVFWDQGLPERRTQLQPEYKANRSETPPDLRPQIDALIDLVPVFGLQSIGVPNTEADDLIATYATAARARGDEVILATNDKDLFQLVDEKCFVYSTNKTDLPDPKAPHALLDAAKVQEKWGVPPNLIGDVLALIGDAVDNIPGIPGIGPKTAVSLIQQFGNLDGLMSNLSSVSAKRARETLTNNAQLVEQNREMVRLDRDLSLPVPLDEMGITPQWTAMVAAMEAFEFRGLTAEVRADAEASGHRSSATEASSRSAMSQGELF